MEAAGAGQRASVSLSEASAKDITPKISELWGVWNPRHPIFSKAILHLNKYDHVL